MQSSKRTLSLQAWMSDAAAVLSRPLTLRNMHATATLQLLALNLHPNHHAYMSVLDDEGLWQQQIYAGVGNAGGVGGGGEGVPGATCVDLKPGAFCFGLSVSLWMFQFLGNKAVLQWSFNHWGG